MTTKVRDLVSDKGGGPNQTSRPTSKIGRISTVTSTLSENRFSRMREGKVCELHFIEIDAVVESRLEL